MAKRNSRDKPKAPAPPLLKPLQVPKNEQSTPHHIVMEGLSHKEQAKLIRIIHECGVEKDDPIFWVFAAITKAQLSLEPVPEKMEALKEGIKSALRAFCEEAQISHKQHQELNYQLYVTAERLSTILSQKLFEMERYGQPQQGSIKLPRQKMFLVCFIASTIGGLLSGLLISILLIVTAT